MLLRRVVDGKAMIGGQILHQADLGNQIRSADAEAFELLLSAPADYGFVVIPRDLRNQH